VFFYNALACLVTLMLDSVWHAILDNFRPATVWIADLFIFYYVSTSFGEQWNASWSWLQLVGMITLLYGTAIYNAPNEGSVKLTGGIQSCYMDCSDEYAVHDDHMPSYSMANSFSQKHSKKVSTSIERKSDYGSVDVQ